MASFDELLFRLAEGMQAAYGEKPFWLIAGEYVITPVASACFPNRLLREEAFARGADGRRRRYIWERSRAFALVDHQLAHVFVLDGEPETVRRVKALFGSQPEVERILTPRTTRLGVWTIREVGN